jgi:hypothetical protein
MKLLDFFEDGRLELYDLAEDISETKDLSESFPGRVEELDKELLAFLEEVGARFPRKDPVYDPKKEKAYLDDVRHKRMPNLEAQRKKFLSEDFNPGNNWWGSMSTKD